MVFFPPERELKKAKGELQPITIKEKFGAGYVSKKGIAIAKDLSFAKTSGVLPPRQKIRGQSQRWDLKAGQSLFDLNFNINLAIADTIAVYKNGGEALVEDRDYLIDYTHNKISLRKPARGIDDDLEIRCQLDVTSLHIKQGVLVLPRDAGSFQFTDEQLNELMPVYGDELSLERLLVPENEEVFGPVNIGHFKRKKETVFVVQTAYITPEGIEADGLIE